ncbi:pectin lyase fold/virulence factor, partial [Mycena rosella]
CVDPDPANTVTDRINALLNSSGPGYVLKLCADREYVLQDPLLFAAPNQEISTEGYPTDNSRATLLVNGPVADGAGHTNAVDGTCASCSGIMLRNVQINGARGDAPPTSGGANIEFGGGNANQTIQFVRSYAPRSWSCLHVAEGPLTCTDVLVQNNDIGPCGVDAFQEWADGISVSCRNAVVRNNMVMGATDGGIVLFGSPGTQVYNNTIWITNQTLLGGINMVDYLPWQGNYTNTVVRNNTILGGYATTPDFDRDRKGTNSEDAVIKIGIAIGPRTWFGDRYLQNVSFSGTVLDNRLSGAFSYGIAMSSAANFTIRNNVLFGNYSFIGASGPNCSTNAVVPTPAPFVYDNSSTGATLQPDFQLIPDAESLTCVLPPEDGDYWPYGGDPGSASSTSASQYYTSSSSSTSASSTVALVFGVMGGIVAVAVVVWLVRRWLLKRIEQRALYNANRAAFTAGMGPGYVQQP